MACHIPSLPQELVDHIIDLCADDKRTARSLALTCHAWTHRSSAHLLRAVSILTTQLAAFLADAARAPRLGTHVAELVVSQPRHGHDGVDLTPAVPALLRALPGLRSLALFGDRISVRAGLAPGPGAGSHRRDLALLRLSRVHVEALPELLQLFGHVDTLDLDHAYVQPSQASVPQSGRLAVDELCFDGSIVEFEALRASLDKSSMKSLSLKLGYHFRVDTAAINLFLESVGQNLEHFRFELPLDGWVMSGPDRSDLPSLKDLRNLRTIELVSPRRAIRRRGTTVSTGLWSNTLAALPHVPPAVSHVHLYANLYHVAPALLSECDLSTLETGLAHCTALRTVEITLLTERDGQPVRVSEEQAAEVQKAARARMGGSFARLLCFS
ncbi:hypothetical protein PsYK624_115140 [Phanerochaete sordida]|uniref:F-box domain-containing protein n=1 Tax=Phanerochaete sordida TaxID=48140 RepID=A0A9P3GHV6_9APHY|nr:hypothetical protein PsYK624_115140 [Phanerochaete sordida]